MKNTTPRYIQQHLDAFDQSGQSITSYCRKYSIPQSTFYYWRRRYRTKPSTAELSQSFFQEIGTLNVQTAVCDIHFPSGITISVHRGAAANEIEKIVECIGRLKRC